jgi:hypothetical protein
MTKVLMTMGLPSDRSHEQSANIEFANSIRCYSDPQPDSETDLDGLREARIRELQQRGGAVPDPPSTALGPPADDPCRPMRRGSVTLGDLVSRFAILEIACSRCKRRGRLQVDRLRDPSYRLIAQAQHLDSLLHRHW